MRKQPSLTISGGSPTQHSFDRKRDDPQNRKNTLRDRVVSEEFDLQITDDKQYIDKIDDFFNNNRVKFQKNETNQIQVE